jgi:uncharacterized protein (DUF924 family)
MTPDDVLGFWFAGDPSVHRDIWFKANEDFDAFCSMGFASTLRAARAGALDLWADMPRGALALTIVLDQFSRNIHRGTADAFAADAKARDVARAALGRQFDLAARPVERLFLYMPFTHSELPRDQDISVGLFEGLRGAFDGSEGSIRAAHEHRDVIRRFGRFPHRNSILGRASTTEEVAWLAEHKTGF